MILIFKKYFLNVWGYKIMGKIQHTLLVVTPSDRIMGDTCFFS